MDGITPAGAGKTLPVHVVNPPSWDHPRRCGENQTRLQCRLFYKGSPPQVRGKHCVRLLRFALHRITPAGAGKTSPSAFYVSASRDHPRRCGENHNSCHASYAFAGSPPQVRGKPRRLQPPRRMRRITPAGAGKTMYDVRLICELPDHPRRCGENAGGLSRIESLTGSPPQVRGKRSMKNAPRPKPGITPAGAGKTGNQAVKLPQSLDHPRRCGENNAIAQQLYSNQRITPAGAGKTRRVNVLNDLA